MILYLWFSPICNRCAIRKNGLIFQSAAVYELEIRTSGGLIAISDNSKVLVHPKLKDFNPDSGIRQYENREIYLPENDKFYPSLYSLREHRKKFGYN